ncbi:MAG: urea ABC transporter permease subunit UrtC [Akkermansiaceae bacterium]|jgi:urea transport system permease protein
MIAAFKPFEARSEKITFFSILAVLVLMLLLNIMVGEGSALHVPNYTLGNWGKYLCYATLAMSLNMLWGYTGLLCLGQCLFFALGGYAFGMHLMLMTVDYGKVPEFMQFMGYLELPGFWYPFYNPFFAIFAVMLVPGLVAFVFGFLAFRSRIKGVYFSILTQALTYAATILFFRNETGFGGNNGFTNFKILFGGDLRSVDATRWLFAASGVLLLLVYWLIAWLLNTKLGKVQQAIRDSENRVRFSGYSTTHFKLFVFVVSAIVAGLAGALYVPQAGILNPSLMEPKIGLDIVVWVAVGGRGTKVGPIIGAILVSALKSYTTSAFPDFWLIILGGLFVFVVLFMPDGIVGLAKNFWARFQTKEATS